jgi:hypothetical protein
MKKRPFGITLLAIFSLVAALVAIWHTLQMLHLAPVIAGPVHFFTFDLFGAILWGIMVLIYLWVFRMLWNVEPQGWLFVTVLSALNLILAFVSILGQSSFTEMGPAIVINGIILIYALLPRTKAAFNIPVTKK